MLDTWYSPEAIKYTPSQIKYFILPYLADLEKGEYPPKPRESGYTTCIVPAPRIQKYQASFVPAVEISAEIKLRLSRLPAPIMWAVVAIYGSEVDMYDYARQHNVSEYDLRKMLRAGIDYISGEDRKSEDYKTWQETRGVERLLRAVLGHTIGAARS
jgi:hypothetical protein